MQIRPERGKRVLAWVEIEDDLRFGVAADLDEERAPVSRVVDRAEDGRRLHRLRRLIVVQVALHELAAAPAARSHHVLACVDAEVALVREKVAEPAVAAREIE